MFLILLLSALISAPSIQHGDAFLSNTLTATSSRQISRQHISDLEVGATSPVPNTNLLAAGIDAFIPPGILGPPELIRDLQIGKELQAFRNVIVGEDGIMKSNFTIERVGYSPDIFCLRNLLSTSECQEIQDMARASEMKKAETITENDVSSRKNCTVAWLAPSNGAHVINSLVSSVANLFLSKSILSNPSAGVEDLQVLNYGVGGEFVLHHDGEPRVLTVIYYINGVGGTWFPLARTSNNVHDDPCLNINIDQEKMGENFHRTRREPQNKAQAMDLGRDLKPGENGLLVKGSSRASASIRSGMNSQQMEVESDTQSDEHTAWINEGDAVVFYNYCDDGSGRLDWRSLHCGLPTPEEDGTKWIANHWFCVGDLAAL